MKEKNVKKFRTKDAKLVEQRRYSNTHIKKLQNNRKENKRNNRRKKIKIPKKRRHRSKKR